MPTFRQLIFLAVALAGCAKGDGTAPAAAVSANSTAPVEVIVASPKVVNLNWFVDQPATVKAFESAPLVAKLPGFVSKVYVDIGDRVKSGQLLAEISIPELVREAEQKRAMVEMAKASHVQFERSVDVAKARLTAAKAGVTEAEAGTARILADYERWESEVKRVEELVSKRVIDSQARDEVLKQFRSAAAAREEVKAKVATAAAAVIEAQAMIGRADADVLAATAHVAVAMAEANRVAALLVYTKITAPFDGVVTSRMVHPGHFLQPTSGPKPEQLFTVSHFDTVRVFFEVPESAATTIATGSKATVRIPGLKGREWNVAVTRTSGVLASESRTLRAEIDLPNADAAIKPGTYATVRLSGTTPDAITVPAGCVLFADETAYVYEVVDGKAVKLRVRVGRIDGGNVELVGKKRLLGTVDWQPLSASDQLVLGNLGALIDGQAVVVKKD